MASRPLSLHDVAAQLGVHYMTVYRYVRLGQLEATKQGANWRVAPAALETFLRRRHRPRQVDRAQGAHPWAQSPLLGGGVAVDWSVRYEARLLAGDHVGAFAVLEAALVAGAWLEDIHLDVVTPALRRVGARWAGGEIDVGDEHRATVIVRQHLGRLSPLVTRRGRSRGTVLVGCGPGERHDLGPTVVVALARLAGFDGVDLGADVPAASFGLAAARADRLVAVGVALGSPDGGEGACAAMAAVHAATPGVPIVVGGPGVCGPEHARSLGADLFGADGRAVVRLLDDLAPRRRRSAASPGEALGGETAGEPVLDEVLPG